MKKNIFVIIALFVSTILNAQIYLEHQISGDVRFGTGVQFIQDCFAYSGATNVIGAYYCEVQEDKVNIYDAIDYNLVKSLSVPANSFIGLISRGIFTTDDKWSYVLYQQTSEATGLDWSPYYYSVKIVTEDGNVLVNTIQKVTLESGDMRLLWVNDSYKLAVENKSNKCWDIYSLPGKGEASTDVVAPVVSNRSSVRKISRNGIVLIESDNSTYTMQGQELR